MKKELLKPLSLVLFIFFIFEIVAAAGGGLALLISGIMFMIAMDSAAIFIGYVFLALLTAGVSLVLGYFIYYKPSRLFKSMTTLSDAEILTKKQAIANWSFVYLIFAPIFAVVTLIFYCSMPDKVEEAFSRNHQEF